MQDGNADLILHNGRVLSAALPGPDTSLVVIHNGAISWVGQKADAGMLRRPATRLIDCEGGTIIPGFIDAHTHLFAYAANLRVVDCSPSAVACITDVLRKLKERAAETPAGGWVRAWGIEEFHLAERRLPLRRELDAATPGHPVKLLHRSGHASVLNSAALRALGISEETPEPEGAMMERDLSTGELTGYLLEMEGEIESRSATVPAQSEVREGLLEAQRRLLSLGITTIHDATPSRAIARWDLLHDLRRSGGLSVRVHNMFNADDLEELEGRGLGFNGGGDGLRVGPVKIMLNETGEEILPRLEEVAASVFAAVTRGFQVAFHAVEERAIATAVSAVGLAYERMAREPDVAWRELPQAKTLRHRIEHGGLCPYDLRRRMASLGMMLVTQPGFIHAHGDRYNAQMAGRADDLYPIASYRRDGIEVAFSSDSPVAPPDPMMGLKGAVTRLSAGGKSVGAKERISAIEALSMYTRGGAYASFDEMRKGRIAPGLLADLVVLDRNPWTSPPEALGDIRALRTIIGGKVVWER